ncbi:hypothetical protein PMAYCL1PPCAC_16296 [Pristionchus mayeri]|uniref:Lin-66-like winged helix domain-containing protein n=1 Tax=Pristionchus mayeri TaxID=1317129 RepID=A0AAN5CKG6_9BILA|nr:hypothetical protein PMAYCL1PPCAC_16296 [Pristionchus mayeri]
MKMAYDHLGGGGGATPLFPSHSSQQHHHSAQGAGVIGAPGVVPSLVSSLWPSTVAGPMPTLPTGPPSLASQLGAPYGVPAAGTRLGGTNRRALAVPGLGPLGPAGGLNGSVLNGGGLGAALYGAPPSVLESLAPPPPPKVEQSQIINGFGKLTWLSSKAGLITCANGKTISFQIKDFCDNQLTDLTSVLRVGFTLSFQAALSESSEYIATLVSPLYGQESEKVFASSPEANLEESMPQQTGNNKDAYCLRIEERAIPTLLAIFQRHATPQIQLSSLHSQMSSVSGSDDELFRYVGSSSLKRRQFIERRTHLFSLSSDDQITLQQPSVYSCVLRLASHLLRRGGVTAIESLYEFYLSPNMPADIRATIGESRARFIELMQSHQWIFSLFPNRTYVSVRRNLPHYDYPEFVRTYFAECELFRPSFPRGTLPPQYGGASAAAVAAAAAASAAAVQQQSNGRGGPGGLSRTMSTHGSSNGAGAPGSGAPQPLIPGATRHQSVGGTSSNGRSLAMWGESETASNGSGGGRDGRDGRGGERDERGAGGGGAAAAWGAFESNNTWRPPSLMTLTTNGLGGGVVGAMKSTSVMATQTDAMDGVGMAPGCVCHCNCGAREAARIVSRGSASPPSAQSASHSPHMNNSPVHNRRDLELQSFQAALDSALPMRYYDPFGGFDFSNGAASTLSALNLN